MRRECPDCETIFLGTETCPGCGWSAAKGAKHTPKAPEHQAPWTPPVYPEPGASDDALIRAELARARALLGMAPRGAPPEPVSRLPAVDPAIRAEVERRAESVAAILPRAVPKRG